jgi:hypothetical protein
MMGMFLLKAIVIGMAMILRHLLFIVMLFGFWLISKVEGYAQEHVQVIDDLSLKDNLIKAKPGDYIVTTRGKNYTVWHVYDRGENNLIIEEITVPLTNQSESQINWAKWVESGAQGNTSWIVYQIDLHSGAIQDIYSYTNRSWQTLADSDNLLSVLLNLSFKKVPPSERKFVGNRRSVLWNPPMYINGHQVADVAFDAWHTTWPTDSSDLSGKSVVIYMPQESNKYPAYLPYWLEISGMTGKAKVRIIDSGTDLKSPKTPPANH